MDSAYRLSIVILSTLLASSVTPCSMPPQEVADPAIQADEVLWLPQDVAIIDITRRSRA